MLILLQIIVERDAKIKQQETEITNLRKKNYEFRSKNTELTDQLKAMQTETKKTETRARDSTRDEINA